MEVPSGPDIQGVCWRCHSLAQECSLGLLEQLEHHNDGTGSQEPHSFYLVHLEYNTIDVHEHNVNEDTTDNYNHSIGESQMGDDHFVEFQPAYKGLKEPGSCFVFGTSLEIPPHKDCYLPVVLLHNVGQVVLQLHQASKPVTVLISSGQVHTTAG